MKHLNNVRFWVWHNGGWVKITLRPEQSLTACEGGRTDEGYSYESTTWTHSGIEVVREWSQQAADCDGRLDRDGVDYCQFGQLHAEESVDGVHDGRPIMRPDWVKALRGQRDYAAEAAGY